MEEEIGESDDVKRNQKNEKRENMRIDSGRDEDEKAEEREE